MAFFFLAAGDPLQLSAFGVTDGGVEVNAYMTRSWHDTFASFYGTTVCLTGQHRQSAEDPLFDILMRVRVNAATDADIELLNSTWPLNSTETYPDHLHLRAVNKDVNSYNDHQLSMLPGEVHAFVSVDKMVVKHRGRQEYAKMKLQTVARNVVSLKVGAQVVLTRSLGDIKAGTRARVEAIVVGASATCRFEGVEELVSVEPATFDVKDAMEEVLAIREQLPLLLAWAVTVSRAQGMSLARVAVDFSCTCWTLDGLVYSSLSRACGFSGLRVRGLTRAHIRCSASALRFYESLLSSRTGT